MKKLIPILIIGLVIRLILMPIGLHPDIKAYNFAAFLIAQEGKVLTFYDHISSLPRTDITVAIFGDGQFNYPPLAYLSHGIFNFLLGPFYNWQAFDRLLFDFDNFRGSEGSGLLLFILKIPYLVVDIACLYLIRKLFTNENYKNLASVLWIFNPATIYSSYLMGQFDIFIAAFMLLASFFATKGRETVGAVSLGIAAGFKPISLVMLPFLPGNKIKNVLIGLLTYGAIIAPYIGSVAFKHYALFASQLDKPLFAKIMVSGSQYLPLFVVAVVFAFWLSVVRPKLYSPEVWLSMPLLAFFAFTHFHPQWMTWLSPFLVIFFIKHPPMRWPVGVVTAGFIALTLSFDKSLHFGLLGLSNPVMVTETTASLLRGVFAASLFVLPFFSTEKS